MELSIQDHPQGVLRVGCGHRELLAYNYLNPDVFVEEVPKPYFHPLRTLGGSVVTLCRPNDHPWHKGIGMTLTKVGDTNFWGGVTYKEGAGYHWIRNHGRQRHVRWIAHDYTGGREASWKQEVAWEILDGETLLREQRRIALNVIPEQSYWTLDLEMEITNASRRPLRIGTYESSERLQGSFYTGLFWRIPREFLDRILTLQHDAHGAVFCEGCARNDEAMHGMPSRWIALHGSVDGVVEPVTVALIDCSPKDMSNPRVFLRKNQVGIALPFQGPADIDLPADATIVLQYRLLIADGHWEEDRLRAFCREASQVA